MDVNGDSGWIKGLPAGWIDGFICARRLFARFRTENEGADPAPWHTVVNADYWGPHFGKTAEEYALGEKLSARLVAVIQKAVFSGQLNPSWFDGAAFRSIPAHAFGNWRIVHGALLHGGFEVDPLWPDDWQHWSNHGWAIPKEQFETWMQTDHALSMAGLPVPDSEMPPCNVAAITARKPSDASRVPLSEAITWIAFGIALDAERLERAIRWESLADGDLQAAQRQMEAATATLLKAGADGLVALYGRHMVAHGEKGKRTEKIDPLTLEDYRKALIVSHNSLYYGEGLFVWHRAPNERHVRGSERGDHYANVTVERDALLKHCGSRLAFDGWRPEATSVQAPDIGPQSTAKGERECKEWLLSAFRQDAEKKRSKKSFQDEALKRFSGRLSARGFIRVWAAIAPQSGRSKPGRKS